MQQDAAERTVPAAERIDLAYLEVWEQPVTAVEDSELFEAALGRSGHLHTCPHDGARATRDERRPRTTARRRGPRQWTASSRRGRGTLNAEHELVRALSLKVDFPGGTNMGDLCSPSVAGGYLGAENQAIRVQLSQANRLTWGFDNASRLYRVNARPPASRT